MCRRHGISSATFYKWKAKSGGLDVLEVRLKKVLEESMLNDAALRDLLGKTKREAVAHLRSAFEMSERRACATIAVDRTMIR